MPRPKRPSAPRPNLPTPKAFGELVKAAYAAGANSLRVETMPDGRAVILADLDGIVADSDQPELKQSPLEEWRAKRGAP